MDSIGSKIFYEEYNLLNKKFTVYNYDENGITAKIHKLTLKWWRRRQEAFLYLKYILKCKNKYFLASFDIFINFINSNYN